MFGGMMNCRCWRPKDCFATSTHAVFRGSCLTRRASARNRWTRRHTSCCICARKTHLLPPHRPPRSRCLALGGRRSTNTLAATACTNCTTSTSTPTDQSPPPARPAQVYCGGGGTDGDRERPVIVKHLSHPRQLMKLPCTSHQYNICNTRAYDTAGLLFLDDSIGLAYRLIIRNVNYELYFWSSPIILDHCHWDFALYNYIVHLNSTCLWFVCYT